MATALNLDAVSGEDAEKLRLAFDVADVNGNGSIDRNELKTLLEHMGHEVSEAQVGTMMGLHDEDGNGSLEFDEVCARA